MYLDKILCLLNDRLKVANENYSGGRYFGLAYPVIRDNKQTFPTVLESEPVYIGADDSYPITIYHRITGKINYTRNKFNTTASIPLSMVVFGVRSKLKQKSEEVEAQLIKIFPDKLTKSEIAPFTGLDNVMISGVSSNLVPADVFAQEYKGVDYFISSEYIYFSISYNLSVDFQKGCLELCDAIIIPRTLCEFIAAATVLQITNCLSDAQLTGLQSEICEGGSCEYDIYLNGVFSQSVTLTNCENLTINLV